MKDKVMKMDIILRNNKFEDLKEALNKIGITGMTVTQVLGCGTQKGTTEYYRGVPYEINLLPKIKIEIVVESELVDLVVQTAKKILCTGEIGDGKIFIYDIEKVIRIRTGEEDKEAIK